MSRKALLIMLYLYTLVFSVLKTLRFPGDWAEAHIAMDYRFGFLKRALTGEIFGWFFEKNEFNILILSAGTLFLLYFFIFTIAVKETCQRENSFFRILFFLIFFLSQYIVFSAHLIGYLDHVVFLLIILIIYLIKQNKILLSSILAAICILVHEISFFLMLPISCFALIINEVSIENFSFKHIFSKNIVKKLALFLFLPFSTTVFVSSYQEMNSESYFSLIFNYLKQIQFIAEKPAHSVASAYTKSFSYYFNDEKEHFLQRIFRSRATVFFGIPILFSLWMIFKEFDLKRNLQLFLLLAAVSFAPLLLHMIAWDTYRIWSFPFMILFLAFWILSSKFKAEHEEPRNLSTFEVRLFLLSFLSVTLVPNFLFDDHVERFSLVTRIIIILPIFLLLFFIKKAPTKLD